MATKILGHGPPIPKTPITIVQVRITLYLIIDTMFSYIVYCVLSIGTIHYYLLLEMIKNCTMVPIVMSKISHRAEPTWTGILKSGKSRSSYPLSHSSWFGIFSDLQYFIFISKSAHYTINLLIISLYSIQRWPQHFKES